MPKCVQKILFVYPESFFSSGGGIGTYLRHAIRAHLDAGRDVHLLTWTTPIDKLHFVSVSEDALAPLRQDQVTILRLAESDITRMNPMAPRGKNISDLLFQHIAVLETRFDPDWIEGSDYAFPLHSYLERRRCGLHRSRAIVATFNHGLLNDVHAAAGRFPSEQVMREFALEIQALRWADVVLVPSDFAKKKIKELVGINSRICMIREPFKSPTWNRQERFDPSRFLYFGRVSFAKGADVFAGMLTAIGAVWPISNITFLGRSEKMPFRQADAMEFLRGRLHPDLQGTTFFLDAIPRQEIDKRIRDFGFFGNFSRSETFSYTTLEALAQGVVPLVLGDSPMAEMLPPDIRDRGTFAEFPHRTEAICKVLKYWTDNYGELMERCQSFAAEITDPARYAEAYERLGVAAAAVVPSVLPSRYTGEDVSILISSYNDASLLREAVDSVLAQTVEIGEILVLDDGSTMEDDVARLDALAAEGTIRLIRVRNMGLVAGRNVLVENARTQLVIFLDADDRLAPAYVEKTLTALNSAPDRWSAVLTRRKNFGINDHEVSSFLLDTPIHWILNDLRMTALIKRKVLEEIRFDPAIRNGEADDWWWWLNFTVRGHDAVFVPEPLFRYRTMPGTMSLPWSEGQAVLTAELLKRAAKAAMDWRSEVLPSFQLAVFTAYKHGWDAQALRVESLSGHAQDQPIAQIGRVTEILIKIVGRRPAGAIIALVYRVARSHPAIKRLAHAALRRVRAPP